MSSPLRAQIVQLEERLRQAMLQHDVDVLDELIAPELLFTSHTGQLVSKEDDLAFHRAGILHLKEIEPSQEQIQLHAGWAVVSILMHLVGTYEGEPIEQRMRYTRVWARSANGGMQIVAGHMSEVQPVRQT